MHLPPTTVAKYGFYGGFFVAAGAAVAMRAAYQAIHIRPEFVYFRGADIPQTSRRDAAAATWIFAGDESRRRRGRAMELRSRPAYASRYRAALAMVQRSGLVTQKLGGSVQPTKAGGGLRCYNLDGGNFFPGGALGVEWKPPRVVMLFAVEGAKYDGIVLLECLKGSRLRGRLTSPKLRGVSTSRPRRRRDASPRNSHVVAAASPRFISAACPRRSRGVATTRLDSRD